MRISKLIHWDCLDKMKSIPDGSIDCVITDPPYWTTACKWDSVIPFEPMWEQLKRIIKPNGAIVLFGSEPFSSALRMSNIKQYKYDWIWEKQKATWFLNVNKRPLVAHEYIHIFYKNQPTYNQQKLKWEPFDKWYRKSNSDWLTANVYWIFEWKRIVNETGYRSPRSIIKFTTEHWLHPTQKPVALIEYLIKTYTNEWDTVLDFTMWSGTTWVACKNTNRNFIGIEMDEKYFDIAQKRIIC